MRAVREVLEVREAARGAGGLKSPVAPVAPMVGTCEEVLPPVAAMRVGLRVAWVLAAMRASSSSAAIRPASACCPVQNAALRGVE